MKLIIIIGVGILIIFLLVITLIHQYNKFQLLIIKVNKGEQSISNALQDKYNILTRYYEILKNLIKTNKDDFEEFNLLNTKSSIYKLDKKVKEMNNIIDKYLDNNEKLIKNQNIIKINKELHESNISLNGCKKYYNDNLINYNHLCSSFPSKIVAKIYRYKVKDFIDEDLEKDFKILNKEEKED